MAVAKSHTRTFSPIIPISALVCVTFFITFNWHFDATARSWLTRPSKPSIATTLDIFTLPMTAHPNNYSGECFTDTSLLFDTHGNPCIDFNFAAKRQGIRAVNTSEVTYLYCAIPKNGCTYHLGLMHRLLGYNYTSGRAVHFNKTRLSVSGNSLQRIVRDRNVPKYFVVRNPLERVLSAYLDKVEELLPAELRTAESFEKWVYNTLNPGMEYRSMNNHWKPQISMCGFGMRNLWKEFRWFKVEHPEEYVDYLEHILPDRVMINGWNGNSNVSFRDATLGPRKRTTHSSEKFIKYVQSLRLFDYLVSCYALDIDGLGYKDEVREMRERLVEQNF